MTSIQRRRVVITGMGTVNPCGLTVPETWEALMAGKSGIGMITRFDTTDFACKIAGEIKGFTGIDDPYEAPLHPELVLAGGEETPDQLAGRVIDYLMLQEIIPARRA